MTIPLVVGVAGGSGSGKTTVVDAIVAALGEDRVSVIRHDAYYRDRRDVPPATRASLNFDHPDALETALLVEHVGALRTGRPVAVPVYDFARHERLPETRTVVPRPVLLLDGILLLADPALRGLIDIPVYVDTAADLRFIRRLRRDTRERGRTVESVVEQYLDTVRPMHERFVEPSRVHAHVVITEGGFNRVAVGRLVETIEAALASGGPSGGTPE